MPSTRASVGDFIAAAIAQPARNHKEILKLEKKLREIEKIEARAASGEHVDSLQREKVARKEDLILQIQELKKAKDSANSVSSETVVFDAVQKLRSISEDQLEVTATTGESPSQATTVSGSDNSGASTPPQEGSSDSFWDDPCPPAIPSLTLGPKDASDSFWDDSGPSAVPSLTLGPKEDFIRNSTSKARWSDDAILDEDQELPKAYFDISTPRPPEPESFAICTPREPPQAPRARIGSGAWAQEARKNSSTWRRVAKDTSNRRLDSYASKVFASLDTDGDGALSSAELRVFAEATGFVDDSEEGSWDNLYEEVCLGAPETGLTQSDFNHLFKGLMADEAFRERISQVYPERSLRQPRRPYNPRGNQSRVAKPMDPSIMTFEEVMKNCTYEEVVRWCWQQGGYSALEYYLGSPNQNYMCESYESYDSCLWTATGCAFPTVYEENMEQCHL
eukprot:gnl/MRDRNA2_/MRDRNA2_99174_c0_seq1.p1 gnl/MRDRNA2_/MRDRNA2_99174_c0~~gnl/MRDRNA2_/MRDRNA2_99174_c0_seq1.p1  ORF type:complete len:450 (+),score=92.55 gnl/MRDRNA2_/MRDRNA2_99174_c0_seq1:198-1547(+)